MYAILCLLEAVYGYPDSYSYECERTLRLLSNPISRQKTSFLVAATDESARWKCEALRPTPHVHHVLYCTVLYHGSTMFGKHFFTALILVKTSLLYTC